MSKKNNQKSNKKANIALSMPVVPINDGQEATPENVLNDIARANGVQPQVDIPNPENMLVIKDELRASFKTWNNEGKDVQSLKDNVLTSFEYVPAKLQTDKGKPTRFSILTCSEDRKSTRLNSSHRV